MRKKAVKEKKNGSKASSLNESRVVTKEEARCESNREWFFLCCVIVILLSVVNLKLLIDHPTSHYKDKLSCQTSGAQGFCVEVNFYVTTSQEMNIPVKYNFPHFARMGDIIRITNMTVHNMNDSNLPGGRLTISVKPIDYNNEAFSNMRKFYFDDYGTYYFYMSELPAYSNCTIYYMEESKSYMGTCGRESDYRGIYDIELYKTGDWIIIPDYVGAKGSGYTVFVNGEQRGNTFRVTSGFEMDSFKDLKFDLRIVVVSLVVTVLFSILSICIGFKSLAKERLTEDEKKAIKTFLFVGVVIILLLGLFFYQALGKIM